MGKIRIISNKPAKIYINEKALWDLKKETKEFELENGEHVIYAKSSWCRSQKNTINVRNEEIIEFTLNSFKYEDLTRGIMMFFAALFMFTKSFVFAIIAGLIFLYPLYYITIGSDKYLELKKNNCT